MEQDGYDVIIVGGRVAGSATGAYLARRGARVLILERSHFPAPTVSCPVLFGNSLASLDDLGLLQAVEAIGAPEIRFYGVKAPGLDLVSTLPAYRGRDYGYSLRREVLDDVLLREVSRRPGITVRQGFNVIDLLWEGDRVVGVRGNVGGKAEEQIRAPLVVGADGKRSIVARKVAAPVYNEIAGRNCLFFAYYRDFKPLDHPSAIIYRPPDEMASVLVFDADDGLTVVCLARLAHEFDQLRKAPEAALEHGWRSIPELAARGARATRATAVMGQGPVSSFYRKPYGPGWALVGDAGYYKDPVTGQGINDALRSAELLGVAWNQVRRGGGWEQALAAYQATRDKETLPMYVYTAEMAKLKPFDENAAGEDALFVALFKAIARRPKVATRYNGIFNGATDIVRFFSKPNLIQIMIENWLLFDLPARLRKLMGGPRRLGQAQT